MKMRKVINFLEEKFPLSLQEEWDNSGLQIGNLDNEVKNVIVSLDLDSYVIKKAIENDCNLIINHHPLIFSSINSINLEDDYYKNIEKLIKEDITVFAMHTNLDKARGGVNDNFAKVLGLSDVKDLGESEDIAMARYGNIKKRKAKDFAKIVKDRLNAKGLILYGDENKKISKVALCGGAGSDFIANAIKNKCDLIVTSDVKYHEALDNYKDIVILDPGHFASENHVIYALKDILEENFDEKIFTYSPNEEFRDFVV